MKIDIDLPEPFYVITAKNDNMELQVLRDVYDYSISPWVSTIDKFTKKFDDKKSALEILNIQLNNFPEQNRNLTCFKIQKIRLAYIIK